MEDNAGGADAAAGTTGVTRGVNQLHFVPEDWAAAAEVLEPLLERLDGSSDSAGMVVITGDVDSAAGLATRLARSRGASDLRVLAATDARRALRAQKAAAAQVLAGTPEVITSLIQSAALKLDAVRVVVLAWVDELDQAGTQALEAVMSEMPKDAARFIIAAHATAPVDELVERYARRARRVQPAGGEAAEAVSLSYVTVGEVARPMALRRVLDALDPESAFVVTRTAEGVAEVAAQLRALGYGGSASPVRHGEEPDAPVKLLVLYDFPPSGERLRALVSAQHGGRVVALVAPRQIASLRRLAGGAVQPLSLPDAAIRARTREERVRDEVRQALAAGGFSRELLTLEPLLAEHDGIEIAAALLRVLELERVRPQAATTTAPAMTRVFVNVGEMDGVRPGDLVGAITSEAGISKAEIGRVEIRERHSTVEVATSVANTVVSQVTGVTIRGRRAMVKIDEGRERRDSDGGARRERGGAPRRDRPPTRPTRRPPTRPR